MKILRITPILIVDRIEPSLELWEKRLGFTKIVEVPHGNALGFVLLDKDGQHLMMQTRKSTADDIPAMLQHLTGNAVVNYIDVDSLDAALKNVAGMTLLMEPRVTFYGAKEAALRDAAGHVVIFAEHKQTP